MSFNIDVGVTINDYHHLRGEGGGVFITAIAVIASTTYMTVVNAPFSPEMTMIVIDRDTNICIE